MPRRSADISSLWLEHGIDIPGKTVYLKGGVDADMLDVAQSAFHLFGPASDVLVLLNSYGGNTWYGMGIYDLLKSHEGDVTVRVVGEACSMGCVILQGADIRQASKNSVIMHHVGTLGVDSLHSKNFDRYVRFQKAHDERIDRLMLERVNERMAATGKPLMTLEQWQDRDTWDQWMFPEDAIAIGLLDEVWP